MRLLPYSTAFRELQSRNQRLREYFAASCNEMDSGGIMRSHSRRYIPAFCILFLLITLPVAPRAAAQVTCTVSYNCHGSAQCAEVVGGPRTLSFVSVSDCNTQAAAVGDGTIASCSCSGGATSTTGAPKAAPAGLTPQQQLGAAVLQQGAYMLGQGLHNLLFGEPAQPAEPLDPAIQQQQLAARQLNNSGIYLLKNVKNNDYDGAIKEFEQALAIEPGDPDIRHNLELAKKAKQDALLAGQNSGALEKLLGHTPAGMGRSATPLNLIDLDSNATSVDLRTATSTTIDPAMLKGQLDGLFSNGSPISEPADSQAIKQNLDQILQPSQPALSSSGRSKIDGFNAQCANVEAGSAAEVACKQAKAELDHANQKESDGLLAPRP